MSKKLTIERMKKIALSRSGWCLSSEYVNNSTKLKWQCKEGHIWDAVPNSIQKGHWCPKCVHPRTCHCNRCKSERNESHKPNCSCAICEAKRGYVWNKGLQGEEYLKYFKCGKIWNTGLTGEKHYKHYPGGELFFVELRKIVGNYWRGRERGPEPEYKKENQRKKMLEYWSKPENMKKHLERILGVINIKPTYLEKFFIGFLEENNLPFKYVGNWSFWIGPCKSGKHRNPDFIHIDYPNPKVVIEVGGFSRERAEDYKNENIVYLYLNKKNLFSENMPNLVMNFWRTCNEMD